MTEALLVAAGLVALAVETYGWLVALDLLGAFDAARAAIARARGTNQEEK